MNKHQVKGGAKEGAAKAQRAYGDSKDRSAKSRARSQARI
jgi:uncharacterized protein YjbJ (UPF0337 family)